MKKAELKLKLEEACGQIVRLKGKCHLQSRALEARTAEIEALQSNVPQAFGENPVLLRSVIGCLVGTLNPRAAVEISDEALQGCDIEISRNIFKRTTEIVAVGRGKDRRWRGPMLDCIDCGEPMTITASRRSCANPDCGHAGVLVP